MNRVWQHEPTIVAIPVHCPLYRLSLFTRYLGWLIDCCCVVMPSWQDFDITEQHSLKAMWLRVRALEDQEHTDCNIIRNLCSSSHYSLSGVQQASDSCAQCCLLSNTCKWGKQPAKLTLFCFCWDVSGNWICFMGIGSPMKSSRYCCLMQFLSDCGLCLLVQQSYSNNSK